MVSARVKSCVDESERWCESKGVCEDGEDICSPYVVALNLLFDPNGCETTKGEVWCPSVKECVKMYMGRCSDPMCYEPNRYCGYSRMCIPPDRKCPSDEL